ncbi:MAG: AAA family ATPase [Thermoflexales bacterium]|nr:AAA family ATPase [Thermoflexales bacterium]MCS7324563.1 AAA family ATPase [Thermoflexales bacterium]MDW8054695.1 R3H domain-containing nucleic acid-binding protein [Anaerolineae bacterium]MDW8293349.1 R3H domain-containing nucleic acid-binding protein [Anaerolineae bacterium]
MQEIRITDDLDSLLNVLPPDIADAIRRIGRFNDLIEVVMDLGRLPESRYVRFSEANTPTPHEETLVLRDTEVTKEDIEYVVARVGRFDEDNRAGITRTLHRIAAIRNRRGDVVGLTCRVGRAVYGTLAIIEDIIMSGKSILLLGRPGVGKTTMLREAARVLAETKRVVIVDTSNEIGGDGDIPHPAVGRARRMQVASPSRQHEVMIEAVENHNPQVIVIDEIGREQEAEAARTIAERGVQLIGTAHGQTLENLMMNPTLCDLVGGIESVTLSDEEARRRGTQKTVLERRAPPTFDVLIEIRERHRLLVHHDVSEAVDALLRNKPHIAELRYWDENGQVRSERVRITPDSEATRREWGGKSQREEWATLPTYEVLTQQSAPAPRAEATVREATPNGAPALSAEPRKTMRLYVFGISKHRMKQAAKQLGVPAEFVDSLDDADVLITAKSYYRQRPRVITEAEQDNIPIYVLRSNSITQMENCLADLFGLTEATYLPYESAIEEAEEAIRRVLAGEPSVELSPQNAFVRRQQHEMARAANLISHSYGKEPMRRVRIFRA